RAAAFSHLVGASAGEPPERVARPATRRTDGPDPQARRRSSRAACGYAAASPPRGSRGIFALRAGVHLQDLSDGGRARAREDRAAGRATTAAPGPVPAGSSAEEPNSPRDQAAGLR